MIMHSAFMERSRSGRAKIEERIGAMPSEMEAFSLWLVAVTPLHDRDKAAMLSSNDTITRLQACVLPLEQLVGCAASTSNGESNGAEGNNSSSSSDGGVIGGGVAGVSRVVGSAFREITTFLQSGGTLFQGAIDDDEIYNDDGRDDEDGGDFDEGDDHDMYRDRINVEGYAHEDNVLESESDEDGSVEHPYMPRFEDADEGGIANADEDEDDDGDELEWIGGDEDDYYDPVDVDSITADEFPEDDHSIDYNDDGDE